MDAYFQNKVAVITGAAGIICSEVARDLASLGITLALVDRNAENLKKIEEEIKALGANCKSYTCDVTSKESTFALSDEVIKDFGKCDYLINGAGGNNAKAQPTITRFDERELTGDLPEGQRGLYNADMDVFESVIKLNTMGSVYPIMAFARYMTKEGSGSIVNFASMNTYCPLTRNFAYAMAKAAVANFTQSFAAYFAHTGVRVNAVAPGFIVNERSKLILGTVEEGLTKRGQDVIDHTPMGKFGVAHDMCGAIRYLIDERMSSFVTGITMPIDGGFLTLSGV
jgi:NAD(P)-dependent dehydrogenase (short-subunit alcohol dehydrogenase family)